MTIGIYKITNSANGKFYIGRSENAEKRMDEHSASLNSGTNACKKMQEDFSDGHPKVWMYEIIEKCKKNELKQREKDLIIELKAVELGYNTVKPTLESARSITIRIEEVLLNELDKKIKELNKDPFREKVTKTSLIKDMIISLIKKK